MANVKGMGPCGIPGENGLPCGRQIHEGESVGTITVGTAFRPASTTGHKGCADAWYGRKQQQERERNFAMVQRVNQSGPGGAVDFSQGQDAVEGSIPLQKPEPARQAPGTVIGDMSQGAHFIGDLPEDASPADAVKYAQGEPLKVTEPKDFSQYKPPGVPFLPEPGPRLADPVPQGFAPASAIYNAPLSNTLPQVDANDGKVVFTLLHLQSQLSIEDAEDLHQILNIQIGRARRQQHTVRLQQ